MATTPCPQFSWFLFFHFTFPALIALSALLDGSAICILPFVKCFYIAQTMDFCRACEKGTFLALLQLKLPAW